MDTAMSLSGWELLAVFLAWLTITLVYGEIERRRALQPRRRQPRHARHTLPSRAQPTVAKLRQQHHADRIPYYPQVRRSA
ncbi:hypothetical protein GCM10012275_50530 [Longimycelium tulufanense]|uniref:Uncharacterized protein n=1 Tax=Longimycelium tulufanense TaxID=907463 RepID=A0A8J3FYP5_9PSEU|nr:hypothetical protein [Longimycelium tulufanense]GGM73695.1 hypothetical protein GCM10012275_50530 [Longimycelium tulufanense]